MYDLLILIGSNECQLLCSLDHVECDSLRAVHSPLVVIKSTLARGQHTWFPELSLVTERIADQAIGIPGSMG
jgi:hypothetical protein